MKRTYLGEFEEIVLLTVVLLEGQAYGVAITHQIIEQTGRSVRLNQVHAALHRLEEKGMVASKMGEATAERGGRRKRLFTITAYGEQTLLDIQAVRTQLLSLLPRALKPSISL
ncbi:PadR family transcriptional regulator [Adhaeribacter radiodurans]|uniref:Helix-turn-helix transcriptional regulator n=1 Tax=Adhaeribacter radiodurans TaxID=2745197 RepID=A0A7L7LAA9_9BACT|nr:helix-turn-helix transcriptional regulator [Adhaeribacter radiodurans]QMU29644.1 helix-turn-helix transcriptional regulator [Adhaeribacter radiodurans]